MEITLGGPGFSAQPCTSFSGQYCEFPAPEAPNVPDGLGTFTITCKALDWFDWENGVPHFKYDTDSVPIVIDSVPPAITITQAPPDGSTLPYTSFRVEGTIDDASPVVLFQTESGIQISTNGSQWFVDITTAGAVGNPPTTVGIPLSGRMDFSVKATDIVGNLIAVSTESQFITNPMWVADPTMAHHWYFDGLPPTVDFSSSSIGSLKQITSIRGTASDNYKLDKIQLNIKENSTGKYWNGSQFAIGITTLTIPLSQVEISSWEYAGLDSDQMLSDSSYTVTATALDFLHGATAILGALELTATFVGEGVVSDMFNTALVQFLVPTTPTPFMGLGEHREICVHYSSPTLKNSIVFKSYPQDSVVVSQHSQPDTRCRAPDEIVSFASIIPTSANPTPALVTGCNDHTEIRAYMGSQIVGRLSYDIITPKKEYSQIYGFVNHMMNPFRPQVTGLPPAICPKKYPHCMGYEHVIVFERGESETRPMNLAPYPIVSEKVDTEMPGCVFSSETGDSPALPSGRNPYTVGDLNGYKGPPYMALLPTNCKDRETQRFFIGKCVLGPVSLVKDVRVVGGGNHMFMTRSDHDNNTMPYPLPPP
ncbi:MAG: hypothetical protein HYX59_05865 [Elusimicrobia bacterium]|nr:hypothetical protein [Elusimicrobiota bacterium]